VANVVAAVIMMIDLLHQKQTSLNAKIEDRRPECMTLLHASTYNRSFFWRMRKEGACPSINYIGTHHNPMRSAHPTLWIRSVAPYYFFYKISSSQKAFFLLQARQSLSTPTNVA
jgi:hypothetical protein